jgi:hypothetical protein
MPADLDSLSCPSCGSYAHPFLEACPACGVARSSRYDEALATPDLGFGALLEDPHFTRQVREVVLRYSLRLNSASTVSEIHAGLATVAGSLQYRVRATGPVPVASERSRIELVDEGVAFRELSSSRDLLRLPFATILAAAHAQKDGPRADAWAGLAFGGTVEAETTPPIDGDFVMAFAAETGELGRLALANQRGLFAAKARPDHFAIVARWMGILAAAAAEARWTAVGARRHAVELGLAAYTADDAPGAGAGSAAPDGDLRSAGGGTGAPGAATSVKDALQVLEELRAAGLVSDAEYAAKRGEILDRL